MKFDKHNAEQAIRRLFHEGQVVEVRVPDAGRPKTVSGYFNDFDKLLAALQ
jgi:hypothetical protein